MRAQRRGVVVALLGGLQAPAQRDFETQVQVGRGGLGVEVVPDTVAKHRRDGGADRGSGMVEAGEIEAALARGAAEEVS